ncbi:MAG: polysaccharide biosynthesis/export family protein [Candidatus Acidiferrales bacterium]
MYFTVRRISDWSSVRFIWLLPLLLLGSAQPGLGQEKFETPQQTNERIQQLASSTHPKLADIPVGAGDLLHVDVFDVPELSRDVRVGQTGSISMPLIPGKIDVAGLTTFQIEEKLAELLVENGLVSHPQVSVFVREQNSQPISVVGAVARPMVYQVFRQTTLLEILAQAGGIANEAGSVVIITRPAPLAASQNDTTPGGGTSSSPQAAEPQIITINLNDLLETGDPIYNIPVYGGDTISVPRAGIIYVAGAVQSPGGYVLQSAGQELSIIKAIALAHGLQGSAKADEAVIIRKDPSSGKSQEIPVRLKKIMARKNPDVTLKSGDILFVPDSAGKKALAKAGEAAIQITTGLALIRASR